MNNSDISSAFEPLATPLIADACLRVGAEIRAADPALKPIAPGMRLAGRALPVRHYGSVDIFLEVMEEAAPGDVLVIDNGGRLHEACIGDLTVLEAQSSEISGLVVWGAHRDGPELVRIGLPVFSTGATPAGPQRLDAREAEALKSARLGTAEVLRNDVVFADDDGVLLVSGEQVEEVLGVAKEIWQTERKQAEKIAAGENLRTQLQFHNFLAKRAENPNFSFREHLRSVGGEIEE